MPRCITAWRRLAAWPMTRAGLHPVAAARVAGRSLSVLGLLTTLLAAYRLARLDGGTGRAGWWAVLLIAATPMLAGQPFAVRPDMVGVALQTAGVLLVLSALQRGPQAGGRVPVGVPGVRPGGLREAAPDRGGGGEHGPVARGLARGRVRTRTIGRGLTVVRGDRRGRLRPGVGGHQRPDLGGGVRRGRERRSRPSGRLGACAADAVGLVSRAAGLIALCAASAWPWPASTRGLGRRVVLVAGCGLIGLILAAQCLRMAVSWPEPGAVIAVAALLTMLVVFPLCALIERSALLGNRLDAALWLYTAAELVLALVLCELSTGAWLNYAIQAVVFGAILTARAASRAVDSSPSLRVRWPVAVAVLSVLVSRVRSPFRCRGRDPPRSRRDEPDGRALETAALGILFPRTAGH